MNKKLLSFLVFIFPIQMLFGQGKYTIRGEFPDNSLDGKYVLLTDNSSFFEEKDRREQARANNIEIKVVGKEFYYEGTTARPPFYARITYDKPPYHRGPNICFVVEPGNIRIHMADWDQEDANVSGTPINEDYNTYIIEQEDQWRAIYWNHDRTKMAKDSVKRDARLGNLATERRSEGRFTFPEKYAQYPDVVRVMLSKDLVRIALPGLAKYLRIVDLMPKADRDVLLYWRDYKLKKWEFDKKNKATIDSLIGPAPHFIETISNNWSS